ncbi:MAG: permease-like cell division protein FtsX [Firmicutes bacterium]|nr:permease-like cell division protein FtsX [Bacillota bacterium]MDD3852018.1 permease-like cell division protein FtsX [Bacillota bacterium]
MKIRTLGLQMRQGISGLWRNRIMSLVAVGSVTAVLLVLGLSLLTIININSITAYIESSVEIKAFLEEELDSAQVETIGEKISQIQGVTEIDFETKETALEKYREQLGNNDSLLEGLEGENNPFPSSYIVKVGNPNTIGSISNEIAAFEGVEEVQYGKDVVDRLLESTHLIRVVGTVLICILAFISVFIISNTIKLTVVARRKEISIMKYIGATDSFIRFPFIIEGLLLGVIGSGLASGLVAVIYDYFFTSMNNSFGGIFVMLSGYFAPFAETLYNTSLILLAVGIVIGVAGSTISLRRFLNV